MQKLVVRISETIVSHNFSPASAFGGVYLSPDFSYNIPAWGQLTLGKSCYHTSISGFLFSLSIGTVDSPISFYVFV